MHPSNEPRVISTWSVASNFCGCSDLDALVVPVGGGGLIGGISVYAKWKRPSQNYWGGTENVDDAYRSKQKCGELVGHNDQDSVADGLKTLLGSNTWPIVRDLVDEIITVDESEIKRYCVNMGPHDRDRRRRALGSRVSCPRVPAKYLAERYATVSILCGGNLDLASAARYSRQVYIFISVSRCCVCSMG